MGGIGFGKFVELGECFTGYFGIGIDFLDEARHCCGHDKKSASTERLARRIDTTGLGGFVCGFFNYDGLSEMTEEYDLEEMEEGVEYYAIRPNKTRIKKDIAALFALGEEISELSLANINSFELPENIYKAIVEVGSMPHKGARKRQLKYIAGQLHKIDVDPILEQMARLKNQSAHAVREHHQVERWRDRLIAEGDDALVDLLDDQPLADRQQLRQLVRNAQKELQQDKPPKSSRLLYRYLKTLFVDQGLDEDVDENDIDDEESELDD